MITDDSDEEAKSNRVFIDFGKDEDTMASNKSDVRKEEW